MLGHCSIVASDPLHGLAVRPAASTAHGGAHESSADGRILVAKAPLDGHVRGGAVSEEDHHQVGQSDSGGEAQFDKGVNFVFLGNFSNFKTISFHNSTPWFMLPIYLWWPRCCATRNWIFETVLFWEPSEHYSASKEYLNNRYSCFVEQFWLGNMKKFYFSNFNYMQYFISLSLTFPFHNKKTFKNLSGT